MASVEEIGIETLALIEILRRAARGFGRTERDLRRLIVDCVESLELAPRIHLRHSLAVILRGFVGEEFEALIGLSSRRAIGAGAVGILMRRGLATRKHLLGETRVQALLLREALVGEARVGEILSGEFRVSEILIVVRVLEARIGETCVREARVGKALVLIGLALEVLRLVITRSRIRLGLGAAEGRRLKRLIRLAAKVRGLIMGRRVVAVATRCEL